MRETENFIRKTWKEETTLERRHTCKVNIKIDINYAKWDVGVWATLVWLRAGYSGNFYERVGFHKWRNFFTS
jgi:hypothetical protein